MKIYVKLLIFFTLFLSNGTLCFSQDDSLISKKNKKHIYASATLGIPVYNTFVYKNDVRQNNYNVTKSKKKIIYNMSFDFDFNHFSLNILTNYCENEFNGNSYKLIGSQLNSGSHNVPIYKYFEIYQTVKYSYLQIGTGFGYNRWYKKHHFSITANFMYNIITKIAINSHFTPNSSYNGSDTTNIRLVKNYTLKDVNTSNALYANLKLTYSYSINKRAMLHFSLNSSWGILDNYSTTSDPSSGSEYFGYHVYYQKIVYPSLGIKYTLL